MTDKPKVCPACGKPVCECKDLLDPFFPQPDPEKRKLPKPTIVPKPPFDPKPKP